MTIGTSTDAAPTHPVVPDSGRPGTRSGRVVAAATVAALLVAAVSLTSGALVGREVVERTRANLADPDSPPAVAESVVVASATPLTTQAIDWAAVATTVQPSVVSILVSTPYGQGQGSGILIDDDGRILTNNHVVSGAEQGGDIEVRLVDGRVLSATIVGLDPATDLAVIQVGDAPDDLVAATLGDSDGIDVGDPVMAIGNPLGLAGTVTTGIVSALDRPVTATDANTETGAQGASVVTAAIQTDAAVNPGNSGGALVDSAGQVIGVNSAIASLGGDASTSGSIGLGFAIPSNEARDVAEQLIADGFAEHARMGVSLADIVATTEAGDRAAAVVTEVVAGSPAADAGIRQGDAVIAVGGRRVTDALSMTAVVRSYRPGEAVAVTLVRDGRTSDLDVTLVAADERSA